MGASSCGAEPSKARLAQLQPFLEPRHAAEVGELRGVVFEAQHAAAIEQLVLGPHDRRQVARQQRAVVEDRLARQPLGVADRQAAEILDQQLERLAIGAHLAAVRCGSTRRRRFSMIAWRSARFGNASRKRAAKCSSSRGSATSWLISTTVRARAVVVLTDVLQQPHVHRIGQERMEVEQHVDAGDLSVARIDLSTLRLGVVLLRAAQIDVQAPQAVGDRPLEHRRVRGGEARRQRGEQLERARLVARLDDDAAARGCEAALPARDACRAVTDTVSRPSEILAERCARETMISGRAAQAVTNVASATRFLHRWTFLLHCARPV